MKRTNSESNRDQRPLLAGLQPLSTSASPTTATASKRNRKHTTHTIQPSHSDSVDDPDVVLDDTDDDSDVIVDSPIDPITPSALEPRFVFNPIKKPSKTIFVEGLSNPTHHPRGSIPHPVPLTRTPSSLRPILELKKLSIRNRKSIEDLEPLAKKISVIEPQADDSINHNVRIILDAIKALTSNPPQPTSVSLTLLSKACEGLVIYSPPTCETLYEQVRDHLQKKAKSISDQLLEGLPKAEVMQKLCETSLGNILQVLQANNLFNNVLCCDWMKRVHLVWKEWFDLLLLIRGILIRLDRTIWIRTDHTLSIWDLGLDLFRKHVLGVDENRLSLLLSAVVCQQVDFDRLGRSTPISSLQSINTLLHTTVGAEGFDQIILLPLIKSTDLFYEDEGNRLILEVNSDSLSVGGPQGYLRHSLLRIEAEVSRLAGLFKTSDETINEHTKSAIVQSVERNLIHRHLDSLLSKGFGGMLMAFPERESSESIQDLYRLLQHLGKEPFQRLRNAFLSWMKGIGTSIVGVGNQTSEEREKQDEEMIQNLISFKIKMDELVKSCFDADREMSHAVKEAFENFINQRHNKPAELIAKYLDQKLRQGNRSMTDGELDQCLNHVLILFRYTQGKDIFEEFYKRDLSKRLLLSKSASTDTERNMVMKLKEECGGGFTAKLETMFRDIETSTDINTAYQTMLKKNKGDEEQPSIELNVSVLTAGSWPSNHTPEAPLNLPNELNASLVRFEKFYQSKYLGRRIKWDHLLGQFILSASFPGSNGKIRKKELSVSTYQGLVLLLFNEIGMNERIEFEKIVQMTGLPVGEAVRTLQSLACGKVRVLVKIPKGKEVNQTDCFGLNHEFKHENFKIKINQIQFKETVMERKSTTDKVVTERSTLLQLSIVRIMKSRKRMKHSELVLESIGQLKDRFQVQPKEIKIAIESLIGRDYIERVTGSMDEYHYLA